MRRSLLLFFAAAVLFTVSPAAQAQVNPFVGQIQIVAFNFAPTGWAECNGQILPISQNTALFSLLGTFYGGDGKSTFALPDLRGRVPIGAGQGPGLTERDLGEAGGEEQVTLTIAEMPAHTHPISGDSGIGNASTPAGNIWAAQSRLAIDSSAAVNAPMNGNSVSVAGGNLPHDNHAPYLTLNYIIALEGVYPPRS